MAGQLLEPGDYELIKNLNLQVRLRVSGLITGEQRSPVQSGGIEFAEYREYQPGDDSRRIDWTVFLRMHRLMIKLCAEEKELTLILIVDTTRSMAFGQPEKLRTALRAAVILAGVALAGGNRAAILGLGADPVEILPPVHGRDALFRVVEAASRVQPSVAVDPAPVLNRLATVYGRRVLAVFLSDLLFPEWETALRRLAAAVGCGDAGEGYLIQILAPEELDPPYLGEITLVDMEGCGEVPLYLGAEDLSRYHRALADFLEAVHRTSQRFHMGYSLLPTALPLARFFTANLRQGGLLA
ncbi:MAG TPA: DUF58 domain-containing protein [Firmicutes bacterium]|jgi:hypothetical protein|nr:DUF58 domain-containing protein [Bacillota bacterium]